jgi:hypothetical protein
LPDAGKGQEFLAASTIPRIACAITLFYFRTNLPVALPASGNSL